MNIIEMWLWGMAWNKVAEQLLASMELVSSLTPCTMQDQVSLPVPKGCSCSLQTVECSLRFLRGSKISSSRKFTFCCLLWPFVSLSSLQEVCYREFFSSSRFHRKHLNHFVADIIVHCLANEVRNLLCCFRSILLLLNAQNSLSISRFSLP